MIVTGALLADRAASVDNKLHVWGGVLDRCEVGPDRIARFVLVVLTQTEAADRRADAEPPDVEVEIIRPSGQSQTMHLDIPKPALAGENGFATFYLAIPAVTDGRYVLLVSVGAHNISLPFTVYS
ncbi:MAG: hypothetical protein JO152_03025 [Mycobacteriaceae bacterium]|nr:hypothetical protein [Mycobacteriaceae bacterium]